MNVINFIGMIISRGVGMKPALAVCCASRLDLKSWRIISLEGKFVRESHNFEIRTGMLVSGKAKIQKIWDGSILVQFMDEDFQIMQADMPTELRGKLLQHVPSPRIERKITLAGKEFYRFRLDDTYYPQQIKWDQRQSPLAKLSAAMLTEDGDSMALLTGYALLFAKKRIMYGNRCAKVGIFLLVNILDEIHTPIFMLAEAEIGESWQKGGIYHFEDLPILYNNDTLSASPAGEAESTLFCGKGKFALVHNAPDEILFFLYDELGDVVNMPNWLWCKYFGCRLDRNSVALWQTRIRALLQKTGKFPSEKTHGWWSSWYHVITLKRKEAADQPIVILAPDFADGGMPRIIALPENVYKVNRKRFPAYAIAVSVSSNPEIIGGAWRPDPESLNLIKRWIINNEAILKLDIMFA